MIFEYLLTFSDDPIDLGSLMNEVKSLRRDMAELTERFERELAEEKRSNGRLEAEMAEEKKSRKMVEQGMIEDMATLREKLTSDMDTINNAMVPSRMQTIAFYVHSEDMFGPVLFMSRIPFPVETVNVGGGWRPQVNAFQAPVAGHYYFSASVASAPNTVPHVRIIHTNAGGDHIVAGIITTASATIDGDANACIINLQANDLVSVQLDSTSGGVTYSTAAKYVTFAGFLLDG